MPKAKKQKAKSTAKSKNALGQGAHVHVRGSSSTECRPAKRIANLDVNLFDAYKSSEYAMLNRMVREGKENLIKHSKDPDHFFALANMRNSIRNFLSYSSSKKSAIKQLALEYTVEELFEILRYILYRIVAYARCHKTKRKMKVYRGIREMPWIPSVYKLKNMTPGQVITELSPTSTSAVKAVARQFAEFDLKNDDWVPHGQGFYVMAISIPSGTPHIDIKAADWEKELIFPPGSQLRVDKIDKKKKEVNLTLLPSKWYIDYEPAEWVEQLFESQKWSKMCKHLESVKQVLLEGPEDTDYGHAHTGQGQEAGQAFHALTFDDVEMCTARPILANPIPSFIEY